ncbi:XPC-binding domain protein [Necator americanus]|uniref:UV excision repair protein RAD23 n=1 Tax=Necator americanus TaxID=51031 RepID=W2TR16_NECAM|nr:XPC-binding domain protein [Necator americanus]ETN84119.1 XPC-binding domain protein [Necator americanus]
MTVFGDLLSSLRIAHIITNNSNFIPNNRMKSAKTNKRSHESLVKNAEGESAASQLEILRQLPQMEELRNLVRSNPEILPSLIQQIAAVNPDLMEVIQNNQDEFLRILNAAPGSAAAQPAGGGETGANPNPYSGRHVIDLTEQEAAAIQRIKSLGFRVSDGLIIEAYLACDKNEEMAIDYILNRMSEDDM